MNYHQFKNQLKAFKIFSIHDIRKIYPDFDTKRLVEWQKKDYIQKIINRFYIFSDTKNDELGSFQIANNIYKPSYISLESALSYYGIIPEAVFSITSITSLKTNQFQTKSGFFIYRHIHPKLMFGFRLLSSENQNIRLAELEKTLLYSNLKGF